MTRFDVCKKCGEKLAWGNTEASTGSRHYCEAKVKVYTKEEIEEMNRKLKEEDNGQKQPI